MNPSKQAQNAIGGEDGGLDDFDREYGLEQLLPPSLLDKGRPHLLQLGLDQSLILHPGGEVYASLFPITEQDRALLARSMDDCPEGGALADLEQCQVRVFPLAHELEVIGYLALGPSSPRTAALESLLHSIICQFMGMNHQILMTTGLHGRVVEDAYETLEERNRLLADSEQKYRSLASCLEKEVERKTEKIQKAQEMLLMQEKMASIGQLAAGVAHEINNPMGFISSNLNSLKEYGQDFRALLSSYRNLVDAMEKTLSPGQLPKEVLEKLAAVVSVEKSLDADFLLEDILALIEESRDGADRIKKIVNDLKDFAHPEKHEIQFVNLNRVMDSTLNMVRNELKYKTEVIREYGSLEDVPCYPQQLGQVFMNLLVNAAQAIENAGEIRITTRMEEECAVVEVRDTGKGIAPEHLSRIFDPFFTTKEVGQGTGLGLNVAYKIIERHKGSICVNSQPGQGACFVIKMPLASPGPES